ncbi:methylase [Geodermatophilus sp. TF02-6]|uniref:methylase n=1 Tax=Geodermatophilus sp. TF02-6 TaxID=2250575 RepID=UPI000DEB03BA|nr:methylase [Geodermatophilus sp. TF02-6]RBY78798.1 methylase [Geodermatophilus sp. TF02-6]
MSWFSSADESAHYGSSVCILLQHYCRELGWEQAGVLELGSGDASAIADAVRVLPRLRVHSYDISASSVDQARENIAVRGVADRYTVEVGDFFERAHAAGGASPPTVIANPGYLPAPDCDIRMPELWGGPSGHDQVLELLKAGFEHVVTTVPSYSDPVATLETARDLGYRVVNFVAMGLDFGPYSSEPKVHAQIRRLCAEGRGWAGEDEYMVAVALFTRDPEFPGDRATHLLRVLQLQV